MIEKIGYIGSVKSISSGKVDTIFISIDREEVQINLTFPIEQSEVKDYLKRVISEGNPNKIKVLNKNDKLKNSKMFINKKAYRSLCKKVGITLEEHLERINTPSETDLDKKVLSSLTRSITKIIR